MKPVEVSRVCQKPLEVNMAKRSLFVGMVAMALVFGMALAGCKSDDDNYADEVLSVDESTMTLASAIAWIRSNATTNGRYTIKMAANATLGSNSFAGTSSLNGANNITIILTTEDVTERTIQLSGTGNLFTLGDNSATDAAKVTLKLAGHITLKGVSSNTGSVVRLNKTCSLEMADYAKITGNTNTYTTDETGGGGVMVNSGTFTMKDNAVITGNTAKNGGGVCVRTSGNASTVPGTFTMNGGTISNNAATDSSTRGGGGVYTDGSASFTMTGGTISGNTASSGYGGGVLLRYRSLDNNVTYVTPTFSKTGGTIYGNTTSNSTKNTAANDSNGHAVYYKTFNGSETSTKKRNGDAGPTVGLSSANATNWDSQ
jgi:hypothetical protein